MTFSSARGLFKSIVMNATKALPSVSRARMSSVNSCLLSLSLSLPFSISLSLSPSLSPFLSLLLLLSLTFTLYRAMSANIVKEKITLTEKKCFAALKYCLRFIKLPKHLTAKQLSSGREGFYVMWVHSSNLFVLQHVVFKC